MLLGVLFTVWAVGFTSSGAEGQKSSHSEEWCDFEPFSWYLDVSLDVDKCVKVVDEFLKATELCSISRSLATSHIRWQDHVNTSLLVNHTKETQKELDKIYEAEWPDSEKRFKVGKHIRDECLEDPSLSPENRRLLDQNTDGFAIQDKKERKRSSELQNRVSHGYNYGQVCRKKGECYRIEPDLAGMAIESRDYDELEWVFTQYRNELIPPLKQDWLTARAITNKWAKKFGKESASHDWLTPYEMTMEKYLEDLQKMADGIELLYRKLHSYARYKLGLFYGFDRVPPEGPIPAHVTGNLWNQKFSNIANILDPYPETPSTDFTAALKRKFGSNVTALAEHCVNFYYELGFQRLPDSFWQKSYFEEPQPPQQMDCHGSAHDYLFKDVRVTVCLEVDYDSYMTLIHELGHIFYYVGYSDQRPLYQDGASSGFHEAIGDTIQFLGTSIPEMIKQGLVDAEDVDMMHKIEMRSLMTTALEKVMFIPNGIILDKWVIDYDMGKIPEDELNSHWWKYTLDYQGITTPDGKPRGEEYMDILGKYHIALSIDNYSRYALAKVYQFQFLKAMCKNQFQSGIPLHNCTLSGQPEATESFRDMLAMGSSASWREAMFVATGSRDIDYQPILDYFKPLEAWLDDFIDKNNLHVGWEQPQKEQSGKKAVGRGVRGHLHKWLREKASH